MLYMIDRSAYHLVSARLCQKVGDTFDRNNKQRYIQQVYLIEYQSFLTSIDSNTEQFISQLITSPWTDRVSLLNSVEVFNLFTFS